MTDTNLLLDAVLEVACAIDAGAPGGPARARALARAVLDLDAALKAGEPLPEVWHRPIHGARA